MIAYQLQSAVEIHIKEAVSKEKLFQRICIQSASLPLFIHGRHFSQYFLLVLLLAREIVQDEKNFVSAQVQTCLSPEETEEVFKRSQKFAAAQDLGLLRRGLQGGV